MKVLQFGQGNFLRTFADVYFETLNQEGLDYQVYVATAIPHENLEAFRRQGNRVPRGAAGLSGGAAGGAGIAGNVLTGSDRPLPGARGFYAWQRTRS